MFDDLERAFNEDMDEVDELVLQKWKKYIENNLEVFQQGGPGSGHHGHAGRLGEVGGSAPSGKGNLSSLTAREKWKKGLLTFEEAFEAGALSEKEMEEYQLAQENMIRRISESPYRKWSRQGSFPSQDEGDNYDDKDDYYHEDLAEDLYNQMNDGQRTSLAMYIDDSYGSINGVLRRDEKYKQSIYFYKDEINHIDSAFKNSASEIDENILVYRGTQLHKERRSETIKLLQAAKDPNFQVIYKDDGYFSSSMSQETAKGFISGSEVHFNVYFEVLVGKGSRALALGGDLSDLGEEEVVFPRGSEFEVLYYTENEDELPNKRVNAKVIMRLLQ